jgi:hypothetical protein
MRAMEADVGAPKNRFFYKLIPPRPTFVQDMTEAEWGVAIVEVRDELEAHGLGTNDAAIKAGLTFDIYPMPKQPLV